MVRIIHKLETELNNELKKAEEIWIAVALLSKEGLAFIRGNVPENCKQNYLIGVDLPSHPFALKKLNDLQLQDKVNVRIHIEKAFYHPKMYLIKTSGKYVVFLGSANCTSGGLRKNIELSVKINEQKICKELIQWFQERSNSSQLLTHSFLSKYQTDFNIRQKNNRNDKKRAANQKKKLQKDAIRYLLERNKFIKTLSRYRNKKEYQNIKIERNTALERLKISLDYPSFKSIDVDGFFDIWDLGHLIPIPKPTIKKEMKKFTKLLEMLCDESIDVAKRYDDAFTKEYKIRGVGKNLISKVLTLHRPDIYYVENQKSNIALEKYGIVLPRGISRGEKYKITAKMLRKICEETEIDNLAVLDYYLYYEGS